MTIQEIEEYFKTGYNFAKETGMSRTAFIKWKNGKGISWETQKYIEFITKGELKADNPEWEE
jgi:hypothetical protein